jgi:DNA invertase Pin-like site-specific DNA recombinase
MSESISAVAYWRMSSSPQERSIPQQRAEMLPKAKLTGVTVACEFEDDAKSGGTMKKRGAFLEMLRFCQERHAEGQPIAAIVCYDPSPFSRATSTKTARYIDEFMDAGVHRLFTAERWFDFRKEEDRLVFNIQQDFTNHKYLKDLGRRVRRGKRDNHAAGYYNGGPVPYGFDRILLDERDREVRRFLRGEKIGYKAKGWNTVLSPIPEDDEDPDRRLERETVLWLYQQYDAGLVSFRGLAFELTDKKVACPGGKTRKNPNGLWDYQAVKWILENPIYAGSYRYGLLASGSYCREINGELRQVEPDARPVINPRPAVVPAEKAGFVDRDLWDRVQARIAQRKRDKALVRRKDHYALTGLLKCGFCGGPMQGHVHRCPRPDGGKYEYRRYECSTPRLKGHQGCCGPSVREDILLPRLVKLICQQYLEQNRLDAVHQEQMKRLQRKGTNNPAKAKRLGKELHVLDAEIVQGRRNLLRCRDDATFVEANKELQQWLDKREQLAKELSEVQAEQALPIEAAKARLDQDLENLATLREKLRDAAENHPREFGRLLRQLVARIDLHFEQPTKRRQRFRFVRGAMQLRPGVLFNGIEGYEGSCPRG